MTQPPSTFYAEVIGDPIAQSKSPLIHSFWLGKLGINAEYRAAVQAEATAALDKVRLDELTYIRKELDRLQSGQPVPDTDEPDLPASLKRLRDDYRQKRAAIAK